MSQETTARYAAAAADKERLIEDAERLATTNDFRAGHQRAQELRAQFNALPSTGRSERELRARFKQALDRFYERRRADHARRAARRDDARRQKEQLVLEAQSVVAWSDAVAASQQMERLFEQWRAAGSAGRQDDDRLWQPFNDARRTVRAKARPHHHRTSVDRRPTGLREWLAGRVANLERIIGQIQYEIAVLDGEIKNIETALYYAGGFNKATTRMNKQLLKKYEIRQRKWERLASFGGQLDAARAELASLTG